MFKKETVDRTPVGISRCSDQFHTGGEIVKNINEKKKS